MAKPSYKAAHKARQEKQGSATMEIEPASPAQGKVVDKTEPTLPHPEELAPHLKEGEHPPLGIAPGNIPGSPIQGNLGVAHPEDYARPTYTGVVKT